MGPPSVGRFARSVVRPRSGLGSGPEQAQVLGVTEQFQAPAQDRVVGALAAVAGDRALLARAGDGECLVQLAGRSADKTGAELAVQSRGHVPGQRPAEHRQIRLVCGGKSRSGVACTWSGCPVTPPEPNTSRWLGSNSATSRRTCATRSASGTRANPPSG